jgi:hypothetical protein
VIFLEFGPAKAVFSYCPVQNYISGRIVKPYDILQVKNAFAQLVCHVRECKSPTFQNYVLRFKSASEKAGAVLEEDTLC